MPVRLQALEGACRAKVLPLFFRHTSHDPETFLSRPFGWVFVPQILSIQFLLFAVTAIYLLVYQKRIIYLHLVCCYVFHQKAAAHMYFSSNHFA